MSVFQASQQWTQLRSISLLVVGIGLGYLAGIAAAPVSFVRAEVTEEPRRESFKAGSVANEPVLREISATLQRIETQVERIERNMAAQAPANAASTRLTPTNPTLARPTPTRSTQVKSAPRMN